MGIKIIFNLGLCSGHSVTSVKWKYALSFLKKTKLYNNRGWISYQNFLRVQIIKIFQISNISIFEKIEFRAKFLKYIIVILTMVFRNDNKGHFIQQYDIYLNFRLISWKGSACINKHFSLIQLLFLGGGVKLNFKVYILKCIK